MGRPHLCTQGPHGQEGPASRVRPGWPVLGGAFLAAVEHPVGRSVRLGGARGTHDCSPDLPTRPQACSVLPLGADWRCLPSPKTVLIAHFGSGGSWAVSDSAGHPPQPPLCFCPLATPSPGRCPDPTPFSPGPWQRSACQRWTLERPCPASSPQAPRCAPRLLPSASSSVLLEPPVSRHSFLSPPVSSFIPSRTHWVLWVVPGTYCVPGSVSGHEVGRPRDEKLLSPPRQELGNNQN